MANTNHGATYFNRDVVQTTTAGLRQTGNFMVSPPKITNLPSFQQWRATSSPGRIQTWYLQRMRCFAGMVVCLGIVAAPLGEAQATSWTAGGSASLSWAGGWPSLDARGRWGWLVRDGHEVGLTLGLFSARLDHRLLYASHYSHSFLNRRLWPIISVWMGGTTTVAWPGAQSRLVVGLAGGIRRPLGPRLALRFDLGHELYAGTRWASRIFMAISLEYLGGTGWTRPKS
jgi:hypothetical protein